MKTLENDAKFLRSKTSGKMTLRGLFVTFVGSGKGSPNSGGSQAPDHPYQSLPELVGLTFANKF